MFAQVLGADGRGPGWGPAATGGLQGDPEALQGQIHQCSGRPPAGVHQAYVSP